MIREPRLLIVDGPQKGATLPLGELCTLGRLASNTLQLPEATVSRRHAEICRDGEAFVLHDLGSRQGTFVNDLPIRERRLEHGDLLRLGNTSVLFLLFGSSGPTASELVSGQLPVESTIELSASTARYLQPITGHLPREGGAEDLQLLLQLSRSLAAAGETAELGSQLLDTLHEALPAARGALLLLEAGAAEPGLAQRRGDSEGAFEVSRTAVEQVLRHGNALLCSDVESFDDLQGAESLQIAAVRSVLAAPLPGRKRVHGLLYFDAPRPATFTRSHLELVAAAGAVAGLAFDTASRVEWLQRENRRLQDLDQTHGMVGEGPAMRRLLTMLEKVARAESTVLLLGESGTGKELAARALHQKSPRGEGPFVALNCATLSETLLESELFGHEKGAFTGAVGRKLGKMELADGGTLFLDEVAEIPVQLQAKLLRVLQEREIERVGGQRPIPVDVRVVAATHRDLESAIGEGRFREDLYYRLQVITIHLPPLRERPEDIPLLVRHFARQHGERLGLTTVGLDDIARQALLAYSWPGNVRQLSNAIERALVLGDGEVIRLEDLPEEITDSGGDELEAGDFQATLRATKKRLILDALEATSGNAAEAARRLGLHPNSLRRLVRQLGLRGIQP